jgi:hypothetical protein
MADALGELAAGELKRKPPRARDAAANRSGTAAEERLVKINNRANNMAPDLQKRVSGPTTELADERVWLVCVLLIPC